MTTHPARRRLQVNALHSVLLVVLAVMVVWTLIRGTSVKVSFGPPKAPAPALYCAKDPWLAGPEFIPCRDRRDAPWT